MKDNRNKEKILNAATILFQEKGYYGTGLNEILRKSNCPKGSLYYYFPNGKEQLAIESIELSKNFVENLIRKDLNRIKDPGESIKTLVEEMVDNLHGDKDDIITINSNKKISINLIALETAKTNSNIRKACNDAYATWEKAYYDKLVNEGVDEYKAKGLAKIIETMIEGAILMSITKEDDSYIKEIAELIPGLIADY